MYYFTKWYFNTLIGNNILLVSLNKDRIRNMSITSLNQQV